MVKLYGILDTIGIAPGIYVFMPLETSPKMLEKLRKIRIFLTLISP